MPCVRALAATLLLGAALVLGAGSPRVALAIDGAIHVGLTVILSAWA